MLKFCLRFVFFKNNLQKGGSVSARVILRQRERVELREERSSGGRMGAGIARLLYTKLVFLST